MKNKVQVSGGNVFEVPAQTGMFTENKLSQFDKTIERLKFASEVCKSREMQFIRYPKFKALYISAFDKMLAVNRNTNYRWKNGQEVFDWWLYGNQNCDINNDQITFFDDEKE